MTGNDIPSPALDVSPFALGRGEFGASSAMLVTYDAASVATTAFARYGIDLPASIGRSVHKRQAEFFMGRLAARAALAALGVPDQPIAIGASRQPLWPAGIVGSITHAGRYAAAVAMRSTSLRGVGIDIEGPIGAATCASIETSVLTPAERAVLQTLAGALPYTTLLTIAFSAKESFFKGTFATVGTYFDFDAVQLTALDLPGESLELTLTRSLAPTLPEGRRFTLDMRFIDADTILTHFLW